ncbi:MAG: DNA methyltransferase [Candidatus Thorarchaeota archaeon]|nr:DNA methyltransferase [Candidatus Thorarchaeota archaeon]
MTKRALSKKRHYIPGLARFYFRPTFDWTPSQAEKMYNRKNSQFLDSEIDVVYYRDCIGGMKELPDESVDTIIADPPFGLDFSGKESLYNRDPFLVVEGYQEVSEYDKFTLEWVSQLSRIMKTESTAYIFSGWTNLESVLMAIRLSGLTVKNHLIWKYQFGVFTKKKFVTSHYHIVMVVKNEEDYFFNKVDHYPLDVFEYPRKYRPGRKKNVYSD